MGNKSLNLEKYLDLWIEFELLLAKKEMKLPTFAKNWDKIDFDRYQNKENPEEVFLDKLKKMKKNKDTITQVRSDSIVQIESYIKFLNKNFTAEILLPDESYEHWFD